MRHSSSMAPSTRTTRRGAATQSHHVSAAEAGAQREVEATQVRASRGRGGKEPRATLPPPCHHGASSTHNRVQGSLPVSAAPDPSKQAPESCVLVTCCCHLCRSQWLSPAQSLLQRACRGQHSFSSRHHRMEAQPPPPPTAACAGQDGLHAQGALIHHPLIQPLVSHSSRRQRQRGQLAG